MLRNELEKRLPDEVLQRVDRARDFLECSLRVAFAEAHASKGLKSLRTRIGRSGSDSAAVRRAVGMGEAQLRGSTAADEQPALVDGEVVGRAEAHEVVGVIPTAFGPKHDVVRDPMDRVPAARDATSPAISGNDQATDCRRDGLAGAGQNRPSVVTGAFVVLRAHVGVDMPDVLRVALGHLENFGSDLDELTAALLLHSATALANRESDLVARTARVPAALERLAAEEQDGCVVVERLARVAADFCHRFAKSSEDFAREVEAEHVTLEAGVRNVVGEASRTMAADEVLDLTHGPAAGGFEPLPLGGRGRNAGELAREGEADGAGLEVAGGFGELFKGFGDAELFLSEAGPVAEEPLGVFEEGGIPEAQVGSCAVGSQKPASLLEIETRALGSEADELFMRLTPCGAFQLYGDC